jgi:ribosome-associated heat shock protein Hsp15
MERVRVDKWLWAARFFKTRTLASKACELGRILVAGQAVKPARDVKVGDQLTVRNAGGEFQVEVLGLSDQRGPAPVAQALYRESEASKEARARAAAERKLAPLFDDIFGDSGRPSKRNRREMERLRGRH